MPRVSVIIPTYNRKDYVQEAIDSVLAQTYTDYEIIVVDDGSTDGTGEALQARYGDRVRYVWQENQGESVARNRGIDLARGTFVAFLDSDDLWLPEKLAKQVSFLATNPDKAMIFSQAWEFETDADRLEDQRLTRDVTTEDLQLESLCFDCPITAPSTVVLAKSVFDASGGFDPAIRYGEDEDLWLRVRLLTEIGFLPQPLARIRRHAASQSYFPSPEKNSQRLAAYLSTREKLFSAWYQAPQGLYQSAVAWQFAKASLREAIVGNEQAARTCLKKAAEHDRFLLTNQARFGVAIAGQVALFFEKGDNNDLHSALSLAKLILAMINDLGYYDRSFTRYTMTACYESLGFTAHRLGDNAAVRYCLSRTLALDPTRARNRGILSLLFEAVFGKKISAARKNIWSRIEGRSLGFGN